MARIAESLSDLIGATPLLRLVRLGAGLPGEVLAKLEVFNPSGSNMDRVVRAMLDAAETAGTLEPGQLIVEPTSGNIAYALAVQASARGYRLLLVMPDAVPSGRVRLLRALGAEVVLTPAVLGMRGARERADQLARLHEAAFRPDQFANPLNPTAHEAAADEIWQACEGKIDAIVVGVSTGGALTGIGRRLKALSDGRVRVIAVQPAASPVLSGGPAGTHRLLGMGPPFVPDNYNAALVDELIAISDNECHDTLLTLYRTEGLMSGPAGGAAIAAALRLAARDDYAGRCLVALVPDSMERYTDLAFWETFPVLLPTFGEGGA